VHGNRALQADVVDGSTSARSSWKIRNISAVQRPMPLTATSASISASSSSFLHASDRDGPERSAATDRAVLRLARDRPHMRSAASSSAATARGSSFAGDPRRAAVAAVATKRRQIVSAALTEIC
jgi:hypothetical protein